jgi:hypothetical protein
MPSSRSFPQPIMPDNQSNRQIIPWIVCGLVAWGVYLAVGDYLRNHNPLRSLVTISCVAIFLGVWLTALSIRRARRAADQEAESD